MMNKKTKLILKLMLMIYWGSVLTESDSYYVPYLAVCIAGCMCMVYNHIKNVEIHERWQRILTNIYAGVLSTCVLAANYSIIWFIKPQYAQMFFVMLSAILIFIGGIVAFREILNTVCFYVLSVNSNSPQDNKLKIKPWCVLVVSWLAIAVADMIMLFGAEYPGIITPDSNYQLNQLMHVEPYSNHHPFYHTQIIRLCVVIGMKLFGEMNAAVAVYSVFSIVIMSGCFAYSVCTVYQLRGNVKAAILTLLCYMLLPYHIKYSYSIWKDSIFGASVLIFVLGTFRIMNNVGKRTWLNYATMLLGAAGITLMRSNGQLVFLASSIIFALFFFKRYKKMLIMFAGILVVSFIMRYPVLDALGVTKVDITESLSIPIQQIAFTIADGAELTDEERLLLEQVVDIDKIPETYTDYLSDPMKGLVTASKNQNYISENKMDFLKLYIQLGIKNPFRYIRAWIEQTKGYWNAGYDYWVWSAGVNDNVFGLERYGIGEIEVPWIEYLSKFEANTEFPPLLLFVSIGFNVWILALATYATILKKDYSALFTSVPSLMTIATLLVATPVFSEFRYAYAVFCCLPFILYVSFTPSAQERDKPAPHKVECGANAIE